MTLSWFALRSKPQKEEALSLEARGRGLSVFYPRLSVRPVNPRARTHRPYFPGYMFIQAERDSLVRSEFRWMPFSLGLVCTGDEPATIPDSVMNGIRRRIEEFNRAERQFVDGLKAGDAVEIRSGPLAGYAAIFDTRLPGRDRVRVLLSLLHDRYLTVELEGRSLERSSHA